MIEGVLLPDPERGTSCSALPDPSAACSTIWEQVIYVFLTLAIRRIKSHPLHMYPNVVTTTSELLGLGRSISAWRCTKNIYVPDQSDITASQNLALAWQMTHLMRVYAYFPYSAMLVLRNGRSSTF